MKKKVVVTGLGTVNPLGNNVPDTWSAASKGQSGIATISLFDASDLRSKIGGEVKNFDPSGVIPAKELNYTARFIQFALYASYEALKDAGFDKIDDQLSPMAGAIIGSGIGGLPEIEETVLKIKEKGPSRVSPFFIPSTIANMASGMVSIQFNLKGYTTCVVSACSTGNHSIGDATKIIERGDAKLMLAGGTEAALCKTGVGGFAALRALSTRNDDPKTASRPYDKDRDGFVMSEGCGVVVLEEEEFAKKRGAKIYAYVAGYGYSSDAYHMTAPNILGPQMAMQKALNDASLNKEDIDYINAHGTSTPLGDINELNAVRALFGDDLGKKLAISSTKSMSGHLLGGAGGLESVLTLKALENNLIPPTINVFELDPGCIFDVTPNKAKEKKLKTVMSNSFGFGGTNATLIFTKLD